jgi:hypothetical protein
MRISGCTHFALAALICGSVVIGASQGVAKAAPITFITQGVFDDGGAFEGTFVFDPQQPQSQPDPPFLGFVGAFSITSTHGLLFNGFTYVGAENAGDAQGSPCGVIQFSFAILNQSQLVISLPGSSFATFNGGPIVNTCVGSVGSISFEQLFPATGAYRSVITGTVSPVPEPSAFLVALACFVACVFKFFRES